MLITEENKFWGEKPPSICVKHKTINKFIERDDYIPLYCLDLEFIFHSYSISWKDITPKIKDYRSLKSFPFISNLLNNNRNFEPIFLALLEKNKDKIMNIYNEFVNMKPNYNIYLSEQTRSGSTSIIFNLFYGGSYKGINLKRGSSYIHFNIDHHYLSEIKPMFKNESFIYNSCGERVIEKPLYSLMIKKEFVPYVRACALLNIKVNPKVLQIWVDKSLYDTSSQYPLRGEFIRVIKKPASNLGIEIIVFNDLKKELIKSPKIPSFKSIQESKNYYNNIIETSIGDVVKARVVEDIPF